MNKWNILGDWIMIPAVIFFAWAWNHGWWMIAGWAVFWVAMGVRDGIREGELRRRFALREGFFR